MPIRFIATTVLPRRDLLPHAPRDLVLTPPAPVPSSVPSEPSVILVPGGTPPVSVPGATAVPMPLPTVLTPPALTLPPSLLLANQRAKAGHRQNTGSKAM